MITISAEQYEALSSLALQGATTADRLAAVNRFLVDIETANNITRYFLNIRWQEARSSLPATETFPRTWPPELSGSLTRFDRPIAKSDVTTYVAALSSAPVGILVTKDPHGVFGWTKIDDYFTG